MGDARARRCARPSRSRGRRSRTVIGRRRSGHSQGAWATALFMRPADQAHPRRRARCGSCSRARRSPRRHDRNPFRLPRVRRPTGLEQPDGDLNTDRGPQPPARRAALRRRAGRDPRRGRDRRPDRTAAATTRATTRTAPPPSSSARRSPNDGGTEECPTRSSPSPPTSRSPPARATSRSRLDAENWPATSTSFRHLVEQGFYDDNGFHRVVPGFVIQGGDPVLRRRRRRSAAAERATPSTRRCPADTTYPAGTVAMAKTGTDPAGPLRQPVLRRLRRRRRPAAARLRRSPAPSPPGMETVDADRRARPGRWPAQQARDDREHDARPPRRVSAPLPARWRGRSPPRRVALGARRLRRRRRDDRRRPRADGCQEVEAPAPKKARPARRRRPTRRRPTGVEFETSCGDFTVTFDDRAPKTAASMQYLAEEGAYDDTVFHRVARRHP